MVERSLTLAWYTVRRPVASVLDLGTGCGIQAMHAARHAGRVVATDVSDVPSYEYRGGGRVGDALLAEFVASLPRHLNPGGTAQLLGNWEYFAAGIWKHGGPVTAPHRTSRRRDRERSHPR